jgi:hypothetical protein
MSTSGSFRELRIFLCHASQDRHAVRELYNRLADEGWIDPWMDQGKLLPGEDWRISIEDAIEAADVVIFCLSNHSVSQEGFVQKEIRFAREIALEKPEGTIFLIPLRLQDCDVPRGLRFFQWTNYFGEEKEQSYSDLLESLRVRLRQVKAREAEELARKQEEEKVGREREELFIKEAEEQVQRQAQEYAKREKEMLERKEAEEKAHKEAAEKTHVASEYTLPAVEGIALKGDEENVASSALREIESINGTHEKHYVIAENYQPKPDNIHLPDSDKVTVSESILSTISVVMLGGVSSPIYYKGDALPFKRNMMISTVADNQKHVVVHLVLGENQLARDNVSIGRFYFDGIPPAPKGVPEIEVQLEVTSGMILTVKISEKVSGRIKNFENIPLAAITPPPVKEPLSHKSVSYGDLDDLFGGGAGGFSEFFRTIFGQGAEEVGTSRRTSQQPQGYQQELEIALEEAYQGTTRFLQVDGKEKLVRIPAGVRTGSKVRVAGAAPNGLDLYLIISVLPHSFFMRTGSDLFMHYPVSETLAYSGGELEVPELEKGKSFFTKLPPNTTDQQVFKFARRGFPKLKEPTGFGDLYLTVDLYDPQKIPPKLKKLLDDIKDHIRL